MAICDESPEILFKFDGETHRFSGSDELLEYMGNLYSRISCDPMDDDSDEVFETRLLSDSFHRGGIDCIHFIETAGMEKPSS